MNKNVVITAALVAAYALGLATRPLLETVRGSGDDRGPVLARFEGGELRLADVEEPLRSQPAAVRERLSTPEGRKQYVEGLVRLALLARRAEEKGYDREPEFRRRLQQELASVYLEKEFEDPQRKAAPTDEEVRQYFEANKAKLSRPERLRLAIIAFRAEDAAARQGQRARAQAALAQVKRRAGDYYAFGELAREQSEEPRSASTSGELPPMSREQLEAGFGPTLAAKAFAMPRTPGTLLGEVVEGERGFFVVKLIGVEPPYAPKFEDVRDQLRARLANDRREAALQAFLDGVWKQAEVRLDTESLARLSPGAGGGASR